MARLQKKLTEEQIATIERNGFRLAMINPPSNSRGYILCNRTQDGFFAYYGWFKTFHNINWFILNYKMGNEDYIKSKTL